MVSYQENRMRIVKKDFKAFPVNVKDDFREKSSHSYEEVYLYVYTNKN